MTDLWFRLRFLGTGGKHRRKYFRSALCCLVHRLVVPGCRCVTLFFLAE